MEIELVIERVSQNKLNNKKLDEQIKEIATAADKRQQSNGVEGSYSDVEGPEERPDGYFYSFKVTLTKNKYRSEVAASKCIEAARKFVVRAAEARQWSVAGDKKEIEEKKIAAENRGKFEVPELSSEIKEKYFDGIYERDSHIHLIHRGVQIACKTNFNERNHVLLYGQPAAAKTVLFKRLKDWYESKDPQIERVAVVNSTTLSKAGLETWLLEKATDGMLPDIICFDEIEKFDMNNLQCLLALMDDQAKISRTNAKIGRMEAVAKVIVWATCNDIDKLREFNKGALFSRFTKRFPCIRPSRELMTEIMKKKLDKRKESGCKINYKWAEVAVNYAFDKMLTNDPRTIASLLDGEDELLTGEYFKHIEAIKHAEVISKQLNLI